MQLCLLFFCTGVANDEVVKFHCRLLLIEALQYQKSDISHCQYFLSLLDRVFIAASKIDKKIIMWTINIKKTMKKAAK